MKTLVDAYLSGFLPVAAAAFVAAGAVSTPPSSRHWLARASWSVLAGCIWPVMVLGLAQTVAIGLLVFLSEPARCRRAAALRSRTVAEDADAVDGPKVAPRREVAH